MLQTEIKRLNWGCGNHIKPGWINSDQNVRKVAENSLPCDIRQGIPLDSNSMDYVVSIHALQEIPLDELVSVLSELRRVLKPGGVLRLCLPDLLKGIDAYRRGDRDYFQVPDSDAKSLGSKLVMQVLWYGYSRTVFTKEFIEERLLDSGFSRVRHCEYGKTDSEYPDIVELDNREAESLFVEATK